MKLRSFRSTLQDVGIVRSKEGRGKMSGKELHDSLRAAAEKCCGEDEKTIIREAYAARVKDEGSA